VRSISETPKNCRKETVMVHELFYTSAERGLELGTSGFCTVARTRGLPKRLERLLHGLSVYKWDLRSGHNPVVYMYTRANLDGQSLFIVSRVAPAPADYSGRSNYFAHHVVLTASELPQAGPVWLMRQPGFLEQQWDGQVRELDRGRPVPQGNVQPRRCTTWERVTGDAGWAGLLLKYVSENPTAPVYLIADDSLPILDLLDEVIALLPIEKRWQATFTTRYIQLPGEVSCSVRVVSPGSEKFAEAKASPRKVDLTALRGHKPADDPYTEAARLGQTVTISEPQYVVAQDEPFLPPGSAAFAQMSGGMPPPRASIVSANPSPTVAPMQPPHPPPIAPRSHTPFWLVLLLLVNLAVTASLAVALVFLHRQYVTTLEQTKNQASEVSNKLSAELQKIRDELAQLSNRQAGFAEEVRSKAGLKDIERLTKSFHELLDKLNRLSKESPKEQQALSELDKTIKDISERLRNLENKLQGLEKQIKESALRQNNIAIHLKPKLEGKKLKQNEKITFTGRDDKLAWALNHAISSHVSVAGRPRPIPPPGKGSVKEKEPEFELNLLKDKEGRFTGEVVLETTELSKLKKEDRIAALEKFGSLLVIVVDGNYEVWRIRFQMDIKVDQLQVEQGTFNK
jgi:uncharacterized protein YoxC